MTIRKIVITGGPCAGKTTGMSWIENAFTNLGYTVLFVPETATEFISGGVAPWTCGTNLDYQKCQMQLQLEKERLFEQAARTMKAERILIVCDRGAIDNKAYMTPEEFKIVLSEVGRTEVELRDSYDGVFHLVTAAKGAEQFYTLENNKTRIETVEQAIAMDEKLLSAWTGHPHLRVIDNATDFQDKMKRLIAAIRGVLGEPEEAEEERKYLIKYPDLRWLESNPNCRKVDVIITYLNDREGMETRVRMRGENGSYIYFKTRKRVEPGGKRIEQEERLSQEEYLQALMDADPKRRPVRKTRYCLTYDNRYLNIDVYPFWDDKACVQLRLGGDKSAVRLPEELEILRDVTGEEAYTSAGLSKL